MNNIYAPRDHEAQGEYYLRHKDAISDYDLYLKSAIAAELAHRDIEIDRLREMLELAAKAVGGVLTYGTGWGTVEKDQPLLNERRWNPLTDDGDALRLAVKLNIPVFPYDDESSTGTFGVVGKNWGSKEANTRRAIVLAATRYPDYQQLK